jgi:RNA polymerase sigma factor (sigma-70 family)
VTVSATITTHATLLARLAQGTDPVVWREFVDRYGELIRTFSLRQGLQPADCDDVLQDVLVALTRVMPGFVYDPAKGKFRSYLKTVTLHAIFKKRFQDRGPVELEHIEEVTRAAAADDAIEQGWETEWRQYHVRLAMRTIAVEFNASDRQAFERYALGGGAAADVAQELDLSVDQVYQAKSRILRRLTELIELQVRDEG